MPCTVHTDIYYTDQSDIDQSFDLYRTNQCSNKLLLFIHGGLWKDNDKSLYSDLGHTLSDEPYNYNVCIINYRVTRNHSIQWPLFQYDIIHCINYIQHNQSKLDIVYNNNVYIAGHSCGATMALLLSTTQQYVPSNITLEQYNQLLSHISGIIGIQGIYDYKQYCIDYPTWTTAITDPLSTNQSIWPQPLTDTIQLHTKQQLLYTSNANILLIHSKHDSYVPVSQAQLMYDALHRLIGDRVQLCTDVLGDHYDAVNALGNSNSPITHAVHKFIQSTSE